MPAKVRGTVATTGGKLEGVGEGMPALVVEVAEAEGDAVPVACLDAFAVREWDTVARTDTLMVAEAGRLARAESVGEAVASEEGLSAEAVARALAHAEALALGDADAERDARPLPLPLPLPLAERLAHDAEAERLAFALAE